MVDFLDWKYLSEGQVLSLEKTFDAAGVKLVLDDALAVSKTQRGPERAAIALDFYYDCYCFCGQRAFSSRKTAAFLSIMHDAFMRDSARVLPAWTMAKSYEALQAAVFKHSVERPPQSIQIFGKEDVEKILDFLVNRTREVSVVRQMLPSEVEFPASRPPLSAAFELDQPAVEHREQGGQEEE